ncbi:MAG: transposase [Parcubacteria group bacterium]
MRKVPLVNEEHYHIFNRGVDKREVFMDASDYWRFLFSLRLMNDKSNGAMIAWRDYKKANPNDTLEQFFLTFNVRKGKENPLVEIIAYCLNPNHYHLILKQIEDRGIEIFMQKLSNGYTKYFNKRNNRSGALFQGRFKSSHIDSNEYLLHVSAYVNCNSQVHGISHAEEYFWSSFKEYVEGRNNHPVNLKKETVLNQFDSAQEYKNFALGNIDSMRERKEMERLAEEDFLS